MATTSSLRRVIGSNVGARARVLGRSVSAVGWVALGAGLGSLLVGHVLGWTEITVLGAVLLALILAAAPFALGQSDLLVELELQPTTVTAGQRAAAQVTVRPALDRVARGVTMELPVGDVVAEFPVPVLRRGAEHEEPFVLPTHRRGVMLVGPVSSVRSDPLALVRRSQPWTEQLELIVHPRTVRLADSGRGFIRDLEGVASNNRSEADISFHALRAYEPGDDPRHIHWLSTARTGSLMVRQFVDTRRLQLGLAVDGSLSAYDSDDDFELALSVAASIGSKVLADEQGVSCVVGSSRVLSETRRNFLDSMARVEVSLSRERIGGAVAALMRAAFGLSFATVITGARTPLDDLRRATLRFPAGTPVMVIRIDTSSPTTYRPIGNQMLLSVRALDELPELLWKVAS